MMASESFDDKTERFHKATGIWPPGRDKSARQGPSDADQITLQAWDQWCKDDAELASLRAEVGRLEEIAHLRGTRCVVCECAIWPDNTAPHCYTCVVHEEHQEAWEDALAAQEPTP